MIDSFKVKAEVNSNKLLMQLRGYFMKSEIELAFYLARREIRNLKEGYEVILDLDGMHTDKNVNIDLLTKARRVFETLGAGKVRSVGALSKLPKYRINDFEYFSFESVGFYPN